MKSELDKIMGMPVIMNPWIEKDAVLIVKDDKALAKIINLDVRTFAERVNEKGYYISIYTASNNLWTLSIRWKGLNDGPENGGDFHGPSSSDVERQALTWLATREAK